MDCFVQVDVSGRPFVYPKMCKSASEIEKWTFLGGLCTDREVIFATDSVEIEPSGKQKEVSQQSDLKPLPPKTKIKHSIKNGTPKILENANDCLYWEADTFGEMVK